MSFFGARFGKRERKVREEKFLSWAAQLEKNRKATPLPVRVENGGKKSNGTWVLTNSPGLCGGKSPSANGEYLNSGQCAHGEKF